ncbi:MAG: protoporphyrinogen oxidase [Actinobacteria bacterium]|nr:protoporphyrinogen oxidase [Actinomycetota bacterium]
MTPPARVVVVGGGIAGLAAAHELAGHGLDVAVREAGDALGGKIRTKAFAGATLDVGPDAFLSRRPEAVELCRALGLGDELVAPSAGAAYVWVGRHLRRLPAAMVLGIPTRLGPLVRSRVLSPPGVVRAAVEPLLPGRPLADDDAALGALVRRRFGTEVHQRLVDPLVGGITAGDTDRLSVEVVAPQLAAAARRHRSLGIGARKAGTGGDPLPGATPPFLTLPGGLGRLVEVLGEHLAGAGVDVRTADAVSSLRLGPHGGYVVEGRSGPTVADAVVLAAPAPVAARLVGPHAPDSAATLAAIEYASVTLVAFAFPTAAVGRRLDGSGFLVARGQGRLMTACSWTSSKWAHVASDDRVVLRVSAGRSGDDRADRLSDEALVVTLRLELAEALGIVGPPLEVGVTRWRRAFPQHAPGHRRRIAAVESELAHRLPGVTLAGAALDGVGLPACIASGQAAARTALAHALGRGSG